MKIGIDPPWYDDPIERMAFNLFAMSIEEENENEEEETEE